MQRICLATLIAVVYAAAASCQSGTKPAKEQHESKAGAEFKEAQGGDVVALVKGELASAAKDGRRLIVYIGAEWCEPCNYFKDAVDAHGLPAEFDNLRFLDFDNDKDEDRLRAGGYDGQMIPRFVVPEADGTGGKRRFEGSIKGPGAVDNIVPRLEWLLDLHPAPMQMPSSGR